MLKGKTAITAASTFFDTDIRQEDKGHSRGSLTKKAAQTQRKGTCPRGKNGKKIMELHSKSMGGGKFGQCCHLRFKERIKRTLQKKKT